MGSHTHCLLPFFQLFSIVACSNLSSDPNTSNASTAFTTTSVAVSANATSNGSIVNNSFADTTTTSDVSTGSVSNATAFTTTSVAVNANATSNGSIVNNSFADTTTTSDVSTGSLSNATARTATTTSGAPTNENATGISAVKTMVNVQGQSGKFTVYDEAKGMQSGVEITMDALREVDTDGNEVGASGSTKHSINTFAAQAFTIDPQQSVTLDNVAATMISFSSPVSSIGVIRVETYILGANGEVGPPGEKWTVTPGDLKWNIQLSNWSWCGCSKGKKSEEGAFIDVDISVKGLGTVERKAGGNKTFSLGSGANMELSDQVMVDEDWTAMPADYPKVLLKGSSATFTFRFPKFSDMAIYDPLMTGISGNDDDSVTTTSLSSTSARTSTSATSVAGSSEAAVSTSAVATSANVTSATSVVSTTSNVVHRNTTSVDQSKPISNAFMQALRFGRIFPFLSILHGLAIG